MRILESRLQYVDAPFHVMADMWKLGFGFLAFLALVIASMVAALNLTSDTETLAPASTVRSVENEALLVDACENLVRRTLDSSHRYERISVSSDAVIRITYRDIDPQGRAKDGSAHCQIGHEGEFPPLEGFAVNGYTVAMNDRLRALWILEVSHMLAAAADAKSPASVARRDADMDEAARMNAIETAAGGN